MKKIEVIKTLAKIQKYRAAIGDDQGVLLLEEAIKAVGKIDDQLIRCENCEYSRKGVDPATGLQYMNCEYPGRRESVENDDYCCYAEEKEL